MSKKIHAPRGIGLKPVRKLQEIRYAMESIAQSCQLYGIYVVESELNRRTLYVENDGDFAIIRSDGHIRLSLDEIPAFIEELSAVYEDCNYRRREHMKLKPSRQAG